MTDDVLAAVRRALPAGQYVVTDGVGLLVVAE